MEVRRVVNEVGARARAAIVERFPDVDVIDVDGPEPPPGLTADVFFGGWSAPDRLRAWIGSTGVRWVQLMGTGVDGVPADILSGHVVCCARGASAVPISEFVLASMLAFEQRMPAVWLDAPPEHWNIAELGGLHGKRLGLVGLGGIGQAVAARALAFGMTVRAVRRTDAPSPVAGVEIVTDLDDLLGGADHVVLAAPATSRTHHLIGAATLRRVTPGVHLVNIARGGLVDQDALRVALDDGRVALASLDCVDPEPLPAGHWLYDHPRVHLTAHISWASHEHLGRPVDLLLENIARARADQPLLHVVDPIEGY